MVTPKTINLSQYEIEGLNKLKKQRHVSQSELIREAIRLLMRQEGIINKKDENVTNEAIT